MWTQVDETHIEPQLILEGAFHQNRAILPITLADCEFLSARVTITKCRPFFINRVLRRRSPTGPGYAQNNVIHETITPSINPMNQFPKTFSHVGLSVPDLEAAVAFYEEVMGWYTIMPPRVVTEESETAIGQMCIDVFGSGWGSFKIAHLSTGDRIGIEMFEFPNNETPTEFEYWKTGTFHFCIQDPNIEELVEKIVAHGGKQRMPIREYYPGEKPYRMVYVEDPFGLVFEIYSHSYELTYSKGAY